MCFDGATGVLTKEWVSGQYVVDSYRTTGFGCNPSSCTATETTVFCDVCFSRKYILCADKKNKNLIFSVVIRVEYVNKQTKTICAHQSLSAVRISNFSIRRRNQLQL